MEFENKINKKSNLVENDSISVYNGWAAQQNPYAFEIFYNFFKEEKPSIVFEIGTALGGFTMYLNYICKQLGLETKIFTFDIHGRHTYQELIDSGIQVIVDNIFLNNYTSIPSEYIEIIKNSGKTVVLCDGGNKVAEFNLLSNYIKGNDFILAHDYAYDKEIFEKDINRKLWNWFEVEEKDIREACNDNKLIDYKNIDFKKSVWVCKQKI